MTRSPAVALLYPGDRAARDRADPTESRFAALFEAFAAEVNVSSVSPFPPSSIMPLVAAVKSRLASRSL